MKNYLLTPVILFFLIPVCSLAQQKEGTLGDEQINVVKPYQPILSDAIKITDAPQKDTSLMAPPELKYRVEEKKFETKYNITPIKPVRIKDENIKELYRGFVKGGYGNYSTAYGELFYNALRSKDFNAGIHLRHLSSSGKINKFGFPGNSENEVTLFADKFLESAVLSGKIGYDRDVVHYYGYSDPPEIYSKRSTLHRMGSFDGSFSIGSIHNDKSKLEYNAEISFYNFTDNLDQTESDFNIGGFAGKHLSNDHYFQLGILLNPAKSKWPATYCPPGSACPDVNLPDEVLNRTIFRMRPRYEFSKNNIQVSAGGNIAIESAYDETKWHLYPVLEAKYPLIKDDLSVFGILDGDLKKNSLRELNKENPFLIPLSLSNATVLLNTSNKINVRGGVEIKPDRELMLIASAGVSRFKGDVFYINSVNTTGITTYTPAYFNNTELNIHAELQYKHLDKIGIRIKSDYYSYSISDDQQPWFRPSVVISIGGNYNIGNKIFVNADVYFTGSRTALSIDGKGTELKSYADFNLGIEYRYSKILSFFVQGNNLSGNRYFHWYRYPSYRINAMAGASLSF